MHKKKELSDRIQTLFVLNKNEFEPELHFQLADEIIQGLDKPKPKVLRLSDLATFNLPFIQYNGENDGIGEYVIKYLGMAKYSDSLGFFPKIEIVHWKDKVLSKVGDQYFRLSISYEGDTVKRIGLCEGIPHVLHLGKFKINVVHQRYNWVYKR